MDLRAEAGMGAEMDLRAETGMRADTPCVAVCSTTFDEVCRGCGRTVIEVAHWVAFTAEQKEVVWLRITAQGYPRRNR